MSAEPDVACASALHWRCFGPRLSALQPPLSPHPQTVAILRDALAAGSEHVLLLGATAALFGLGERLTMVDKCGETITRLWPGDDPARHALVGDWRALETPHERYTAVIGDGSFNALGSLADIALVAQRLAAVAPGALALMRSFIRPAVSITGAELGAAVAAGQAGGFHAFKLRLLITACHEADAAEIRLDAVHALFERLFPDRAALAARTGWAPAKIAEIDAYRDNPAQLCFPSFDQFADALGLPAGLEAVPSGAYEAADLCPILRWRIA